MSGHDFESSFHTDCSISDSLKSVRKSVLIYETIISFGDYEECMFDEVVSDKRCKMLDNITDKALMLVSYAIMRNKRAGYQGNILYSKWA